MKNDLYIIDPLPRRKVKVLSVTKPNLAQVQHNSLHILGTRDYETNYHSWREKEHVIILYFYILGQHTRIWQWEKSAYNNDETLEYGEIPVETKDI